MRIVSYYQAMLHENLVWLRRISIWAGIWTVAGFLSFAVNPGLWVQIREFLTQIFTDILGPDPLPVTFVSVWAIFQNNWTAALLTMFLGIFWGIVPLFAVALNFFILGFIGSVFFFAGPDLTEMLLGLVNYFLAILPHGIFEIPALLIAAAFGLRLGFSWAGWRTTWKQSFGIIPLLTILLFFASLVEVFITGKLLKF